MEANFIGNAENESAVKSVGSEIFRFKGTFWKLMWFISEIFTHLEFSNDFFFIFLSLFLLLLRFVVGEIVASSSSE